MTKNILSFFFLVLHLASANTAKAETLTATFDKEVGLPQGWEIVGSINNDGDRGRNDSWGLWTSNKATDSNYIITEPLQGEITLFWRSFGVSGSYPNGQIFVYRYDYNGLGEKLWTSESYKGSTWKEVSISLGDYQGRVAIALYSACIDDVSYTPTDVAEGAKLEIEGFPSGSTYDYDGIPVPAGTTKTFTLMNIGSDSLFISSITVTGEYTITEGADIDTIAPKTTANLTVSTPEKDTEGMLTIFSNDADSPYTITLTSKLKIPTPLMVIAEQEVNFGKVTENAIKKIGIENKGEADLIANITSDNTDFTVYPASLNIKPNETDTFEITYIYNAEAYGQHTGTITITPNVGEPFSISVSAKVNDPHMWSEDFSSNTLPTGWEVDDKQWTFADGVAHSTYGGYNEGYNYFLTTPVLEVAEGDELEFQAKSTGYYATVRIFMSKDGGDFVSCKNIELDNNMSEFATFNISGLQPGSYLFRFANDDYDLDNFSGLSILKKEHNAQVAEVSIPATGQQYLEYTATVNVKELAGKSEHLVVKFFIGEKQYGEDIDGTVEGYSTKTFTVTFTPDEAVSGEAYFTISNEQITLETTKTPIIISQAPTLSEDKASLGHFENWGNYSVIVLNYTMKEGWNTLILPFAVNDLSVFGEQVLFYDLSGYNNNNLTFIPVTSMNALQPYLVYSKEAKDHFLFYDVKNVRTTEEPEFLQTKKNDIIFQGFYTPAEAGTLTGKYVLTEDETGLPFFKKATEETALMGFRAYIESASENTTISINNERTGIGEIKAKEEKNDKIFNLNGQQVKSTNKPGLYIVRGRIFSKK